MKKCLPSKGFSLSVTELGGRRSDQGETRYKLHRAGKARSSKRPRFSDHRDVLPSTMAPRKTLLISLYEINESKSNIIRSNRK